MGYSSFQLSEVVKKFDLQVNREQNLFDLITEVTYSEYLQFVLDNYLPLAIDINTEKARSEMIITPILLELKQEIKHKISLFSGKPLTVNAEQGLNGECDYIISLSPEQLFIRAPIVTLVEAKNEDIIGGLGQCVAQMLAAQIFNEREGNKITSVYGVVTTGTTWRFLRLTDKRVDIDTQEYYISNVPKIMGIFHSIINSELGG
ncbi:MAG: hypothetical protein EBE86_000265 [Hormoscilla sp. GUM202]|nr:hypothetical protein [Hormoscilla sp. GUM202]